jgi:2-oxo-3-hexenedioate decarboxylase
MPNSALLADDILAALSSRQQMPPLSGRIEAFDTTKAYRISRSVTARRVAQGETVIGRKIGFTNRTIWDEYGVHQPIYGPMYDTTVREVAGTVSDASLSSYVEPRIEPEIVLGLSAAPEADMDEQELMSCIGWIAHGFEIVQSLFPGWVFKGSDCVAAFGLHGGLLVGPRTVIPQADHALWLERLKSFSIRLNCDGGLMDTGHAVNVLDGPVSALRHLVGVLALDAEAMPLTAGEMITTGTLTRAFPVSPGQRWQTALHGIDLPGLDVTFV